MLKEFKEFAMRGNVLDLTIGVIIGAAFSGIVSSLVDDIVMPIIGAITGGLDFSNYFVPLSHNVNAGALAEAKRQGAVFAYGSFLTKLVNFVIIAWVLFLVVKAINRFKRQQENAPPPKLTLTETLLTEIRDQLRARPAGPGGGLLTER